MVVRWHLIRKVRESLHYAISITQYALRFMPLGEYKLESAKSNKSARVSIRNKHYALRFMPMSEYKLESAKSNKSARDKFSKTQSLKNSITELINHSGTKLSLLYLTKQLFDFLF